MGTINERHVVFWDIRDEPEVCHSGEEVDARVIDERREPEVVVMLWQETGSRKWQTDHYCPNLAQLERDARADWRQYRPRQAGE